MIHRRLFRLALLVATFAILGAGLPTGLAAAPAADIAGNTYTSPQFGYTVTWPGNWYVEDETSDAYDRLHLADGLSFMAIVGGRSYGGNALTARTVWATINAHEQGITDYTPLLDGNGNPIEGGDATRAYGAYSMSITFSDGTTGVLGEYIEARTLIPGEAVVVFDAYTLLDYYYAEQPQFDQVIAGFTIPAPPEPELIAGEPGPAFVSGSWRVAVAAAAQNDSLSSVGLKEKSGKEWLLVVADVTNWSDDDATFAAKEFGVRVADSSSLKKLAAGSTKTAAKALEVKPDTGDMKVAIPAGETERIVMVFQLPEGSDEPALVHEGEALPLTDILDNRIDGDDLPERAGPPKVTKGELLSAADGETLRVQMPNKDKADKIRLLGVDAPAKDDCYADEAKAFLSDLAGETVLLEKDDSVTGGSGAIRYVWLVNRDGTRTLINQQVIVEGYGEIGAIPAEARFAAWLGEGERAAEASAAGLWTACAATPTPTSTNTPSPTSTPAATNTPRPTSTPAGSPAASPSAKSR